MCQSHAVRRVNGLYIIPSDVSLPRSMQPKAKGQASQGQGGEVKAEVNVPTSGFRRSLMFNRFSVERLPEGMILHFGLVGRQGFLLDSYSCIVDQQCLTQARDRHLTYLDKFGGAFSPNPDGLSWSPSVEPRNLDLVRFIFTCHAAPSCEISLCGFSIGGMLNSAKKSPQQKVEIEPDPLAVLGCSLEMQRYFITKVFLEARNV